MKTGYANGSDMLLMLGSKCIGHCTEHSVTMSSETKNRAVKPAMTSAMTSGLWKDNGVTGLSLSISASGFVFYDEAEFSYSNLVAAWKTGQPVTVKCFARNENGGNTVPSPFLQGSFVITSAELNTPAQDDATYSLQLENAGEPEVLDESKFEDGEDGTNYSVTRSLYHVNCSNTSNYVAEGSSFSATLTAASGYENVTVSVTMGGFNITNSAVSGNVITIASVTGNIVITATATQIPPSTQSIYAGGAFTTAQTISPSDVVIAETVNASARAIEFGVDEQNHIAIIAPTDLTLTSVLHIDAITEDLTEEFLSSMQTVTYSGQQMKMYQFKSPAGKMYDTTFRATFN